MAVALLGLSAQEILDDFECNFFGKWWLYDLSQIGVFEFKRHPQKKSSCISDKVCFCNNSRYLPQRIRWLRQCEFSPSEAEQNRKLASWLLPQLTRISTKMIQEQSPKAMHISFFIPAFGLKASTVALTCHFRQHHRPLLMVRSSTRSEACGSEVSKRYDSSNLSFTVVGLVVLSCRICQNMQVVRIPEDTSRIFKVTSVHLLVKGKKNAIHGTAFGQKKAMNPIESQSADLSIDFITSPSTSTVSAWSGLEMAWMW